jgi:dishevelled associated activator of morphogenesis
VLAFGNYMNRGTRGSALGFRVSSLNKLQDTKTSSDRTQTLLHYIVGVCETTWADVLGLDQDMGAVKEAAKIRCANRPWKINVLV